MGQEEWLRSTILGPGQEIRVSASGRLVNLMFPGMGSE
jgi:hypothetical protein